MRRLLILTALALMTASAGGCLHWFNRGSSCGQSYQGTGATYADPCLTAPTVTEGTSAYSGIGPVSP